MAVTVEMDNTRDPEVQGHCCDIEHVLSDRLEIGGSHSRVAEFGLMGDEDLRFWWL